MDRRHMHVIAAVVALAATGVLTVVGLAAPPAASEPTEVLKWNRIAMSTLLVPPVGTLPPVAGGAPSAAPIHLGMTQGAVYDAVNAIEPKHYRPYLLKRRFAATASEDAAVATAAYEVLSSIVQGVPQTIDFPNRQALLNSLLAAYNDSLDDDDSPAPFKAQGIAAGHAAAEAMIAAREGDGRYGPSQWRGPPNGDLDQIPIGHWTPKLPNGTVMLDPTPWIGGVNPFLIETKSQFRTDGPNPLTSDAYTADFNEVKALGGDGLIGSTPSARTPDQTRTALFWTGAGGPYWSVVARDLIGNHDLDLADSARLLAMMNLAAADAVINCWNDKYYFDFWRPWTAIARAAEDGNPLTDPLPAGSPPWTPLRSAPYPAHPSGHMCLDGGSVGALQLFFGTDEIAFDVSSFVITDHANHYDRFSQPLDEIENARVWAGLHFRTDDEQGEQLGLNVAAYMGDHFFQPVGRP
jgi:hypothetical protein